MSITYSLEFQTVPDKETFETMALQLATTYLTSVNERLDQGIGSNGQQMPAYSAGYKRRKRKFGRQTRVRDLSLTNQTRSAFQLVKQEIFDTGFIVTFGFITERARRLAQYNQLISPFVGFAPYDVQNIQAALDEFVSRKGKK